jgi:hypothetical protein
MSRCIFTVTGYETQQSNGSACAAVTCREGQQKPISAATPVSGI